MERSDLDILIIKIVGTKKWVDPPLANSRHIHENSTPSKRLGPYINILDFKPIVLGQTSLDT